MWGSTSELLQRNSMRVVVCRHETGAGYMAVADVDACCSRRWEWRWCRAGRAWPTPWGHRCTALIIDATGPMVVLVGQVERKDFGRLALQEQNYSRLLADTTKLVRSRSTSPNRRRRR